MIATFRNTAPGVYQKAARRSRIETCSFHGFENLIRQESLFTFSILQPKSLKSYTLTNAKMNKTRCPKKVTCKRFKALKMANISKQDYKRA